jgi:hypothetical protein
MRKEARREPPGHPMDGNLSAKARVFFFLRNRHNLNKLLSLGANHPGPIYHFFWDLNTISGDLAAPAPPCHSS